MTQTSPTHLRAVLHAVAPSKLELWLVERFPATHSLDPVPLRYVCPTCGEQEPRPYGGIYVRRECECAYRARQTNNHLAIIQENKRQTVQCLLHSAYTWLDRYNPALPASRCGKEALLSPNRLESCTFASWVHLPHLEVGYTAAHVLADHAVQKQTWIQNLFLVGRPGIGKTHLAASIVAEVTAHGIPARFTTVKRLFDLFYDLPFGDWRTALWREVERCPVLCLDELDKLYIKAGGGDFQRKTLQELLNARNTRHLPTILTANEENNFSPWLEESSLSRLFDCDGPGGGQTLIEMVGTDYRLLRAAGVSL